MTTHPISDALQSILYFVLIGGGFCILVFALFDFVAMMLHR